MTPALAKENELLENGSTGKRSGFASNALSILGFSSFFLLPKILWRHQKKTLLFK
ncbi:hypothetical protein RU99_GL000180 [Enterococcus casseliflavus]|jgi:hypothetical protein|nr:hypothetical protein RU99_GL000180 [Enterococcus casseliflavus]